MNRFLISLGICLAFLFPAPSLAQDGSAFGDFVGPIPSSSSSAGGTSENAGDAMVANFKAGLQNMLPAQASEAGGSPLGGSEEEDTMSTAVEIALILTVLSVLPALLITVTCFTRIVIVLSFVRRAMSINELPPNPVLIGLALFLTAFIMGPVATNIYEAAYVPYQEKELTAGEASDVAWGELSVFLLANTRQSEIELFTEMSGFEPDATANPGEANVSEGNFGTGVGSAAAAAAASGQTPPMRVVVPAFILSELKTAFQMGFLLFLPFLVIDLVISSVLLSMGMFMLPPVMISTPFKILLFVLVDGWHLIVSSLVTSFAG
ncbi:MAG: flagellar biosynthetic protein FliP [Bacteroidia bacterium]|jgi:flagellar biosynthetic protein FliP